MGTNRKPEETTSIAFSHGQGYYSAIVHFTEKFFDQQLDWYKSSLTQPFDVDGHGQAAILIHEFAHLFSEAVDIAYLESRLPFSDLVDVGHRPMAQKINSLKWTSSETPLSMKTPKEELFARWGDSGCNRGSAWIR